MKQKSLAVAGKAYQRNCLTVTLRKESCRRTPGVTDTADRRRGLSGKGEGYGSRNAAVMMVA